jgi:hypothetical protein
MSDNERDVTETFSPFPYRERRNEAVAPAEQTAVSPRPPETLPQQESSQSAELGLLKDTGPLLLPERSTIEDPPSVDDRSDWINLQQEVPPVAAECLSELDGESSADVKIRHFMTGTGKVVFGLVRDIAWSAAVHCGVQRPILEKLKGDDRGSFSDWRLSNLHGLYGEMEENASLVTTDFDKAPTTYSARQEFNCRVHLLRILYKHADGRDSEKIGIKIAELCAKNRNDPDKLVEEVVQQASALRWLRGCTRKVKVADLRSAGFPGTLRDLANAIKHEYTQSPAREKLFFDYWFPGASFAIGCWPAFRPAVVEWMRASRLDSLCTAKAVRAEGARWLMKVDEGRRSLLVDPGKNPITIANEYVVSNGNGNCSVMFPFLMNLSLPEGQCPK